MNTVKPYFEIHPIDTPIITYTNENNDEIVVSESYCVNPTCQCNQVLLIFFNQTQKVGLFSFRLNFNTYDITDKVSNTDIINIDENIENFMKRFEQIKKQIKEHYEEAKRYGINQYLDKSHKKELYDEIKSGVCVNYQDLFESIETLNIKINNQEYMIIDQYCMNPKCHCEETLLSFYNKLDNEPLFTIRLPFISKKYKIEDTKIAKKYIDDIMKTIINDYPDLISTLKSRYRNMKEIGNYILNADKPRPIQSNKIGPNDSCPCGSGKKYKKCCM